VQNSIKYLKALMRYWQNIVVGYIWRAL